MTRNCRVFITFVSDIVVKTIVRRIMYVAIINIRSCIIFTFFFKVNATASQFDKRRGNSDRGSLSMRARTNIIATALFYT